VIDPQSVDRLQAIVRRESLSMLMYIGQAYPWTTVQQEGSLAELKRIVDAEREAIAALGQYLTRHRVPVPSANSYPSSFTTLNFLSLQHILPRLIAQQRGSIVALEIDLPAIQDTNARAELTQLLQLKEKHLREMELLATPQPASA
jgi:hypothetical protein